MLACPLDWNEDVPGLAADVVVASDVCYDPAFVPDLVRLLAQLLLQPHEAALPEQQQRVVAAYVSTTLRHPATLRLFEDTVQRAGLALQQLDASSWLGRLGGVMFQALPALEARSERFVLHRVTAAAAAAAPG